MRIPVLPVEGAWEFVCENFIPRTEVEGAIEIMKKDLVIPFLEDDPVTSTYDYAIERFSKLLKK